MSGHAREIIGNTFNRVIAIASLTTMAYCLFMAALYF